MATTNQLERYLDALIDANVFRTRREIAEECGMTDAALSMTISEPQNRRLSVEHCLRLARRIREYPATVLREAGRSDVADVVEDLWPRKPKQFQLTRGEREFIDQWRLISVSEKHYISGIVSILAAKASARTAGRGSSARGGAPRSSRPKRANPARAKS